MPVIRLKRKPPEDRDDVLPPVQIIKPGLMVESEDGVSIFNVYSDGSLLPTLPCGRFRYVTKQVSKDEFSDAYRQISGLHPTFKPAVQLGDEQWYKDHRGSQFADSIFDGVLSNVGFDDANGAIPEDATVTEWYFHYGKTDYTTYDTRVVYFVTFLANCKGELIQPLRTYYQIFTQTTYDREVDPNWKPSQGKFWDEWNKLFGGTGVSVGIHIGVGGTRPIVSIGGYDLFQTPTGTIGSINLRSAGLQKVGSEPTIELMDYLEFSVPQLKRDDGMSDYIVTQIDVIGPGDPEPPLGNDEILLKLDRLPDTPKYQEMSSISANSRGLNEAVEGKIESRSKFIPTTGSSGYSVELPRRMWVKKPGSDSWEPVSLNQWKSMQSSGQITSVERWRNGKKVSAP